MMSAPHRAMLLSQGGPGAARWLSALPTCPAMTLSCEVMQIALRRRLRAPLPAGPLQCRGQTCRARLDALGDHLAACMRSGLVRRRASPLEDAWAQIFREAGARVATHKFLRDAGLPGISPSDGRRIEVVAYGLPLFHGVPLWCDATLVSPLTARGESQPRAAVVPGVSL